MSQHSKIETDETYDAHDKYRSRQEARLERRATRRAGRGWLGGILLIALGALFLLQNVGYFPGFTNWWALFLLLPTLGIFSAALRTYQQNENQWNRQVMGLLLGGLFLFGFMIVFLFDLNLGLFGPLFLIGAGVLLLFGTLRIGD